MAMFGDSIHKNAKKSKKKLSKKEKIEKLYLKLRNQDYNNLFEALGIVTRIAKLELSGGN